MITSTLNPNSASAETACAISIAIEGIAYGALVTLGIVCLKTLWTTRTRETSQDRGLRNIERYLWWHVLVILMISTFVLVWNIRRLVRAMFYTSLDDLGKSFRDWSNIFVVLVLTLTDGLLVS